jgi:hypothetical protein
MKKMIVVAIVAIFSVVSINAQKITYGGTVGYSNLIAKASFQGISSSSGESGLYVGLFVDFKISNEFHLQPEVQYSKIFVNGESGNELLIPVMVKYYVAEKFSVQLGPQFDLILDESPGIKKLGIGLATGIGYDITQNLFATARYSLGLNNRLDDDAFLLDEFGDISIDDISTKLNFFQVGLGYRF